MLNYAELGRFGSKVKILYWDRTGRFPLPATLAQRSFTLAELNAWLDGIVAVPAQWPALQALVDAARAAQPGQVTKSFR